MREVAASGQALVGLLALGLCAGLGSGSVEVALRAVPSALLVAVGTAVLTGPALLVVHPFVGLDASPAALISSVHRGFCVAGRVALGLSPVMLFLAATSGWWSLAYPALALLGGTLGLGTAAAELMRAEPADGAAAVLTRGKSAALALGWGVLAAMIGVRLSVQVASFVAFG
jgi:hypothetical protein